MSHCHAPCFPIEYANSTDEVMSTVEHCQGRCPNSNHFDNCFEIATCHSDSCSYCHSCFYWGAVGANHASHGCTNGSALHFDLSWSPFVHWIGYSAAHFRPTRILSHRCCPAPSVLPGHGCFVVGFASYFWTPVAVPTLFLGWPFGS